jgi:hypothetical protein
MNDIDVEFLGGETVKAKVIASEPAADLSLIQTSGFPRAPAWPRWPTRTPCRWATRSTSWAPPTA